MKMTVTSWSFPACTLAEAWGIARALGFGAMDLGLLHHPALDRAKILTEPEAAAAEILRLGIRASNLYWLFGRDIVDRAVSGPASRDRNCADLAQVCRFAKALSIPTIFLLPGVHSPAVSQRQAMQHAAASLRQMTAIAADHGVTLTVEPHIGGLLASPDDTLALLAEVPGLRLTLDYAHFICMGFTQAEVDVLAPYAAHVHMRQARPGALQAKWGEGVIDMTAMINRLSEAGYDGYLSVEYVHQAYMNTVHDDVLTETLRMRDHLLACNVR